MTGFDLPSNFNDNPESLVRRVRPHVIIPQKSLWTQEMKTVDPVGITSSAPMAESEDHVWFEDRWMVASLCDE
jgi:hypothetical protein